MYGDYLVMERRKKVSGVEHYCVALFGNLLEALLDANRFNAGSHGSGDGSTYYVRHIRKEDIADAKRRALQQERALVDYFADGVITESAEELLEQYERTLE